MNAKATGQLSKTALEVVRELFVQSVGSVVSEDDIRFEVDALNSQLTITGREINSLGEVGNYVSSFSVGYDKSSIEQLIPFPLFVDVPYPNKLRVIRTFIKTRYGIEIEEGDLSDPATPAIPYQDDDYIEVDADISTGYIELTTAPTSGRFIAGQTLRLIFPVVDGVRRINDVFNSRHVASIEELLDSPTNGGSDTAFNAEDSVIS